MIFHRRCNFVFNSSNNCSEPTCGGRNYLLNWFFFVQTILANRYIHRREMLLVSLISSSIVEFEIKKILFEFCIFEEISKFKFCVNTWYLAWFCSLLGKLSFELSFFFLKTKIQHYNSRHKKHKFCVPKRRKAIKKISSDLIENITIKKVKF